VSGKRECTRKPGTRFNSKKLAKQAEIQRKINGGANGQRVALQYTIEFCQCNGYHLMTVAPDEG
jgi:predicted chitinase